MWNSSSIGYAFWVEGNVLYLDCGGNYTTVYSIKIHQIAYLKPVIFAACKLCLNEIDFYKQDVHVGPSIHTQRPG